MKKLLALTLAVASLGYGQSAASQLPLGPPPRYSFEEPSRVTTTQELFDKLATVDEKNYCLFTDDERLLLEQKAQYLSTPDIYVELVSCFARTLPGHDAAVLVDDAVAVANPEWKLTDLPLQVLQHLYAGADGLFHQGDSTFAAGSDTVLWTARDFAKAEQLNTSQLERALVEEGYAALSKFYDEISIADQRLVLDRVQEVAKESGIDDVNLRQGAGERLEEAILQHLKYSGHPADEARWHQNYPYLNVRSAPYIDGYRLSQELLLIKVLDTGLIDAALDRAKGYLPYAKERWAVQSATEALDFAAVLSFENLGTSLEDHDATRRAYQQNVADIKNAMVLLRDSR